MAARKGGLTAQEVAELAQAVAAGKRVTVYLRDPVAGLGLAAGASARVVSVDGSTVTVRPRGVDDDLPYEAEELRRTKDEPAAAPVQAAPRRRAPAPAPVAKPVPAPAEVAAPTLPEIVEQAPLPPVAEVPAPVAEAPTRARPAARPQGQRVRVTITGSAEEGWTAAVAQGRVPLGDGDAVSPGAVLRAVRELGSEAAFLAVQESLAAAREAAARRIAELSKELEEAKAAFDALG